jgi:hypothetical protein
MNILCGLINLISGLINWIEKPAVTPWIAAIIASIMGGLVTGLFMMWQNKKNYEYNMQIVERDEKITENAVLHAIETEIKVNRERYNDNIKPLIDKLRELSSNHNTRFVDFGQRHDDKRYFYDLLSYKISISQDYFTIYNGNSSYIGKIKDDDIRKEIVSVYTNIKGLIDKILLFGLFQDRLKNSAREIREPISGNAKLVSAEKQFVDNYKNLLEELADFILQVKNEQDKLDIQIQKLLKLLKDRIN